MSCLLAYRDECLVQLLNTERPRLGPLPIPHARCRLQPKNLYRSFVSSSRRVKTGYKCHLCSQPFSSARIQVKPLSELSSRTLRIAPIHRCTKTRRSSESELTRVGRYPIQKHVSLLAESVLPTEIMIGVYDRLFDACPPSQLIPKSAGPRFSFASYTGLRNRETHYQDACTLYPDANVNIKTFGHYIKTLNHYIKMCAQRFKTHAHYIKMCAQRFKTHAHYIKTCEQRFKTHAHYIKTRTSISRRLGTISRR